MFKKFADKYNDGMLDDKYYQGISLLSLHSAERTGHKWKLDLSRNDKEALLNAKDDVEDSTSSNRKIDDKLMSHRLIEVPINAVGMIIGKGGTNIDGLRNRTKCSFDI